MNLARNTSSLRTHARTHARRVRIHSHMFNTELTNLENISIAGSQGILPSFDRSIDRDRHRCLLVYVYLQLTNSTNHASIKRTTSTKPRARRKQREKSQRKRERKRERERERERELDKARNPDNGRFGGTKSLPQTLFVFSAAAIRRFRLWP